MLSLYCHVIRTNPAQCPYLVLVHYRDVMMGSMASLITSLTTVYSTVHSGADQRKHQSSASPALAYGEFTGDRWISHTNGQQRGKCFHLMTSSWWRIMFVFFQCLSNQQVRLRWFMISFSSLWSQFRQLYLCDLCARKRCQGQGQIITSRRYCGM